LQTIEFCAFTVGIRTYDSAEREPSNAPRLGVLDQGLGAEGDEGPHSATKGLSRTQSTAPLLIEMEN